VAKPNYSHQKKQREQAARKKREEKQQRRQQKKEEETPAPLAPEIQAQFPAAPMPPARR